MSTQIPPLSKRCRFTTKRLEIQSWREKISIPSEKKELACVIVTMLTPNVTRSLPDGWQKIDTLEKASDWIHERDEESFVFTVKDSRTRQYLGFLILFDITDPVSEFSSLKLGYFLSEDVWGKGIATELVEGLIVWCKTDGNIRSISGGVELTNVASRRVLEKCGFIVFPAMTEDTDTIELGYTFGSEK